MDASMSRRGNCHDNAVAESFFANLKKEKIRQTRYKTCADARHAMFEYIQIDPHRIETPAGEKSSTEDNP